MDIIPLLTPRALQNLYTGEKIAIVQIMNFKRISERIFWVKIRDKDYRDVYVCQIDHHMHGVLSRHLVQTREAICISIPALGRKSVKLGPTILIYREAGLDKNSEPSQSQLRSQYWQTVSNKKNKNQHWLASYLT